MHELFEHTADLGLRASAPTLEDLFSEAAAALLSAIVEDPTTVRAEVPANVAIEGTDRDYLLFDLLKELLFRFDTDHALYRECRVTFTEYGLDAFLLGEPLDPTRHVLKHEVKAITYHELKVVPTPTGWLAEAIVDI